ncbi:MAG: DUF5803 family protein [Haloarculaceae archaeon]
MTRRRLYALGLLALLVALAGCSSVLGPSQPSAEQLNAPANYDWNTNATTSVDVSRSSYTTIVTVHNRTYLEVYQRSDIGTENPVSLKGLRFRYPNGTVLNGSELEVHNTRKRTNITLPASEGKVAYTASRNGKRFSMPLFVEGSHEVTLPPGARVGIPLLSQVTPNPDSTAVVNERMTVSWKDVERGPILVRYYLERDIYLFGGLLGLLVVVGTAGALYYLRQIRRLERKRETVGPDVDTGGDEFDDGPPPGMR